MSGLKDGYPKPRKDILISQPSEEKVLGMIWEPIMDVFKFTINLNFNSASLETITPNQLTRRLILSQLAKVYDPFGLLVSFLLHAKILMREMCTSGPDVDSKSPIKWDAPVELEIFQSWIEFFRKLREVQHLRFHRCIKPKVIITDPVLIVFSDGSNLGYGCCAYIRWQASEDEFVSYLLVAKNRIAPRRQITTPRLELCGTVLASRIREKIVQGTNLHFAAVIQIIDSTIVRWQIQKESYGFKSFVATRVGEIQSKTEPSEWWWIQSDLNPADLTTRITCPRELGIGSVWQSGPAFMKLPINCWPISKSSPEIEDIPDKIAISMAIDGNIHESCSKEVI